MNIVHIGDKDLLGSKFNGHDLHLYQRELGHDAYSLVVDKASDDETTFVCRGREPALFTRYLFRNPLFLDADVAHLQLIHNTPFDLMYLPILSSLKPVVWTLHDPWLLGGHCIHHMQCTKWRMHCRDCEFLDIPFPINADTSALEFAIKSGAVGNSQIHFIVTSRWMEDKAKQSPILAGKRMHSVPFGINQDFFKPAPAAEARRRLGIDPDSPTLFLRPQSHFKGLDIMRKSLAGLRCDRRVALLSVGSEPGLLSDLGRDFDLREYGWVRDDTRLAELYQASDIFLMPSEYETFGLMAIEAMSCGKMVMSLSGTALADIVNAPDCGVAVSAADYAGELNRLLANPDEVLQRGEKSLAFARERYGHVRYVNDLMNVYEQAVGSFRTDDCSRLVLSQLSEHARDSVRLSRPKHTELHRFITGLGNHKTDTLCIFCAGDYGLRLYNELATRNIGVDFFSDNNTEKWGRAIAGNTVCIAPDDIDKEKTLLLVACAQPARIVNQLRGKGFFHAIPFWKVWEFIHELAPGDGRLVPVMR